MLFPQVTFPVVIWGLYAGIAAAMIGTFASRFRSGRAIEALLSKNASSAGHAKTAEELGLDGAAKRALHGAYFGKLFFCANLDEAEIPSKKNRKKYKKPRLDMSKARFYLPETKEYRAMRLVRHTTVTSLASGLFLLTAMFLLMHMFLPSIIDIMISAFRK